jgi:hypothetical protein
MTGPTVRERGASITPPLPSRRHLLTARAPSATVVGPPPELPTASAAPTPRASPPRPRGGTNDLDNLDVMDKVQHEIGAESLHRYPPGQHPYGTPD